MRNLKALMERQERPSLGKEVGSGMQAACGGFGFGLFGEWQQGGLLLFVVGHGQGLQADPGDQQGQCDGDHCAYPATRVWLPSRLAERMVRQQFQAISSMPLANIAPPARRTM